MGQDWGLYNLDKREGDGYWGKLGAIFFSSLPEEMFYRLVRLSVTFDENPKDTGRKALTSSCFPKFAAEIVASIFNELDDAGECFSLALTSTRCWIIGQPRMKAFVLDYARSWAGDRILCIGDYIDYRDHPEGVLTSEELQELDEGGYGYGLRSLCDKEPRSDFNPSSLVSNFLRGYRDRIPQWGIEKLEALIQLRYQKPDILRNLSKRLYVRRAAILEMREICPAHWHIEDVDLDLGHALFSRICWSTDSYTSMFYDGPIYRGIWAGDRFDITSADALEETDEKGQQIEWEDVTKEVLEELRCIWSSQYDNHYHWQP